LLRALLADHVLVEDVLDLAGARDGQLGVLGGLAIDLLGDDVVAEPDALVADVDRGTGDELLHLLLRLAAEGAAQALVVPSIAALARHGPAPRPASPCWGKDPVHAGPR